MDSLKSRLHQVDIQRIRIFMTIVERGGFAAAQNELGISPSSISIRMSELEQKLGLNLCRRGRAGFSVTPEGEAVYRACQSLMMAHESFSSQVSALKGVISGELKLGVIDNAIFDPDLPVSRVISDIFQQSKELEISLYTLPPTELERSVLEHRLHLGIGVFYQRVPGLVYEDLCHEKLQLYCGDRHHLFSELRVSLEKVQQCAFIERTYGQSTSRLNRIVDFNASAYASSLEATALLILSGEYIGFLPEYYARLWIDRGMLKPLLAKEIFIDSEISMITHKTPQNTQMTEKLLEVTRTLMAG